MVASPAPFSFHHGRVMATEINYPYTHVRGTEVIAVEQAASPLPTEDGRPYLFTNLFKLLLADERTLFACGFCEYTHRSTNGVRAHMKIHKPKCACKKPEVEGVHGKTGCSIGPTVTRTVEPAPVIEQPGVAKLLDPVRQQDDDDVSVEDILGALGALAAVKTENETLRKEVASMTTDRDNWRDRAEVAERKMADIRNGIAAAMGRV